MTKNIVLCCDGTGNQISTDPTNVLKLWWVLEESDRQVCYYHPGVGTMGNPGAYTTLGKLATRALDAAIGHTLGANFATAYRFLVRHYEPGDSISLFGFSRGAYVARALAGALHMVGLVERGAEDLAPYVWLLYSNEEGAQTTGKHFAAAQRFKSRFAQGVRVHFIGVWDTVSSVGFLRNRRLPFTAAKNTSVDHVRHAVAIHERRAAFRQNLWGAPVATQDVKEVWFAGAHADVGGGYEEKDAGLSKLALKWILREAESFDLLVDQQRKADVLGADPHYSSPDPGATRHNSLTWPWWPLEFWPRMTWIPPLSRRLPRLNLFRSRWIADGAVVHESVKQRHSALGPASDVAAFQNHPAET
jgi:uncharacterized protein (DUF2235 family)